MAYAPPSESDRSSKSTKSIYTPRREGRQTFLFPHVGVVTSLGSAPQASRPRSGTNRKSDQLAVANDECSTE